jgi:hypothetical protein
MPAAPAAATVTGMTNSQPVDRVLTTSLIIAPAIYFVADLRYGLRGWDDPTGAAFQVLGATAYILVLIRLVSWSSGISAAVLLVVGVIGAAGSVGYSFNTIHVSLGDTDLVDAAGVANLIKPMGLCFPLSVLIAAWALRRTRPAWIVGALAVAGVLWPIAHIANIPWLATLNNVLLLAAFGALAVEGYRAAPVPVLP